MSRIDPEFAQKLKTDLKDGLGVTVDLHIRLHENGAMSISGPTGDMDFCLQLLEHAKDAIRRQAKPRELIVPAKDLDL